MSSFDTSTPPRAALVSPGAALAPLDSEARADYLQEVAAFCDMYRRECFQLGVDYVQLDTSMQFDRALTEYLVSRRSRY